MFDLGEFIASCQSALKEHAPQLAAKELMERTMSVPGDVESAFALVSYRDQRYVS